MKKSLITLSLLLTGLLFNPGARAQKWTVGYRTGAFQDNFQFNDQFAQGGNLVWNNQVFIDRRIGKRLEIELNGNYGTLKAGTTSSLFDQNNPYVNNMFQASWKTKILNIGAYLRYYFYRKNAWEAFGYAGTSCTQAWSDYDVYYYRVNNPAQVTPVYEKGKDDLFTALSALSVGGGANYALNKHLQLSGNMMLSYKGIITNYGSTVNKNDFSPMLMIGAGYRF